MKYSEFKELLGKIKVEASTTDKAVHDAIYSLFKRVYGRHYNITCSSCFFDCYTEMRLLKEEQFDIVISETNSAFKMKVGPVLYDVKNRTKTWVSHKNTSEKKVIWHLCFLRDTYGMATAETELKKKFYLFPENWPERIENKICGEFPEVIILKKKKAE